MADEEITTEWHDGPLRSIRRITVTVPALVEVKTTLAIVSQPFTIGHDDNAREVTVRFRREELQQMLDLIDGKPVVDFFEKTHT